MINKLQDFDYDSVTFLITQLINNKQKQTKWL